MMLHEMQKEIKRVRENKNRNNIEGMVLHIQEVLACCACLTINYYDSCHAQTLYSFTANLSFRCHYCSS